MPQAITTSIRLPHEMRKELERISHKSKQGKNGIIIEALKSYFQKISAETVVKEARSQSLLASKAASDASWDEDLDFDDWKTD